MTVSLAASDPENAALSTSLSGVPVGLGRLDDRCVGDRDTAEHLARRVDDAQLHGRRSLGCDCRLDDCDPGDRSAALCHHATHDRDPRAR